MNMGDPERVRLTLMSIKPMLIAMVAMDCSQQQTAGVALHLPLTRHPPHLTPPRAASMTAIIISQELCNLYPKSCYGSVGSRTSSHASGGKSTSSYSNAKEPAGLIVLYVFMVSTVSAELSSRSASPIPAHHAYPSTGRDYSLSACTGLASAGAAAASLPASVGATGL